MRNLHRDRLAEILQPLLEGRHEVLLRHCAELVLAAASGASDIRSVGEAAGFLHDQVRAFLERHGRWPIRESEEYARYAMPAAIVIAAWTDPDEAEES